MDRLRFVIIFTGDVAGMKHFYGTRVGLTARKDTPGWVEFDTGGATLALHAMPDAAKRGVQLRFTTDDIDARVRELAARGVTFDPPGVESLTWGKLAYLWDPEGNHLTLWQPVQPSEAGKGPGLTAVVNCRDLPGMRAYYRDALGFPSTTDSLWWVQLSVGEAGLGLHPRAQRPDAETHHGGAITIGLGVPDLVEWVEEARERGLEFTAPPTDRGFGTFADAVDPDGNEVSFRDVPEPETLEERLAEPFGAEDAPRRGAIRKPVKKRATAGSRLVNKPAYREAKPQRQRPRAAKPSARTASPRGTGPAGARKTSKRQHDPTSERTKPAIGRLRKAERRTLARKRVAVATAGKTKPVKRAATRTGKAKGKSARRATSRTRR